MLKKLYNFGMYTAGQIHSSVAAILTFCSGEIIFIINEVYLSSPPSAFPTYMIPLSGRKISLNTYTPAKIQPTPLETLPERTAIEKPTLCK